MVWVGWEESLAGLWGNAMLPLVLGGISGHGETAHRGGVVLGGGLAIWGVAVRAVEAGLGGALSYAM